jgi:DNA-binding NarL/FixJ family response regulator
MKRIRILLADDHTLFCSLLRDLLEPEYEIVGSVSDGQELLKAALSLRPDVVLADIGMPSLNGLDAGRRLKRANPNVKLITLFVVTVALLVGNAWLIRRVWRLSRATLNSESNS